MQNEHFCMFCYYRNKRLAACDHVDAGPHARPAAAPDPAPALPSAAVRPSVQPPGAKRPH